MTLDEALLTDPTLLPPISPQCLAQHHSSSSSSASTSTSGSSTGTTTTYSYTHTPPSPHSSWSPTSTPHEPHLFLATLSSTSPNPNQTYTLRIGTGGNIYSLIGPYGEAIPPQSWDEAPWVDEVQQSVAVDPRLNTAGVPWFVHNAGSYRKDTPYTDDPTDDAGGGGGGGPFYSPSVAKHCSSEQLMELGGNVTVCTFASWGQHGHVPTHHYSPVLYYSRYVDCGDGVLEQTFGIHSMIPRAGAGGAEGGADDGGGRRMAEEEVGADGSSSTPASDGGASASSRRHPPPPPTTLSYLNVPWGGVRTSNLRDVLLSHPDGTLHPPNLNAHKPQTFGARPAGSEHIVNLRDTGGYTVFVQDLPHDDNDADFHLPCVVPDLDDDGTKTIALPSPLGDEPYMIGHVIPSCTTSQRKQYNATRPTFVIARDDPAQYEETLWTRGGKRAISIVLKPTVIVNVGCLMCQVTLSLVDEGNGESSGQDNGNGVKVRVRDVRAWSYGGTKFVFHPLEYHPHDDSNSEGDGGGGGGGDGGDEEITPDLLNGMFKAGDELTITLSDHGKPPQDNVALGHVHGIDSESLDGDNTWFGAPTRLRHGLANYIPMRDYTVYTINVRANVEPGDTFVYRQYLLTDSFLDVADRAKDWVDETIQDMVKPADGGGHPILLVVEEDGGTLGKTFGAVVGSEDDEEEGGQGASPTTTTTTTTTTAAACPRVGVKVVCTGRTVPTIDTRALFQVSCGGGEDETETYVGHDPYYFSPPSSSPDGDPLRSYACRGQDVSVRPRWKLLGFFVEGECDELNARRVTYDRDFDCGAAAAAAEEEESASSAATTTATPDAPTQPVSRIGQILLEDIMPPISSRCTPSSGNATSYTFRYSPSSSSPSSPSSPHEGSAFQALMSHTDPNDPDKSWTARFGTGGNVYSLMGPYGEALPTVWGANPYTNRVWETVVRNGEDRYVVAQSGSMNGDTGYTDTDTPGGRPFYSPSLGRHCNDNACSFASWGQERFVPTDRGSDVLYFSRYADCGDGVLEETTVVFNAADPADDPDSPTLRWMYAPHRELRTSTFQSMITSTRDGSTTFQTEMPDFDADATHFRLRDTGGYTTFAENLRNPNTPDFEVPCYHPTDGEREACDEYDLTELQYQPVEFVAAIDDFCVESSSAVHSNLTTCTIRDTVPISFGCFECHLLFANNRTGDRFEVVNVLRWAEKTTDGETVATTATTMSFQTAEGVSFSDINSVFRRGDAIEVQYVDWGLPPEENSAISFVHGTDGESSEDGDDWFDAPATARYGQWWLDNTAFRTIVQANTKPGQAYVNRNYIVSGPYTSINEIATGWVSETFQKRLDNATFANVARAVTLYSTDRDTFGAVGGDETTCPRGESRCVGTSVPQNGKKALFAISCGTKHYVGTNRYHFTPASDAFVRPYVCDGDESLRPSWTLLGYFRDGDCSFLTGASFDDNYCADGA